MIGFWYANGKRMQVPKMLGNTPVLDNRGNQVYEWGGFEIEPQGTIHSIGTRKYPKYTRFTKDNVHPKNRSERRKEEKELGKLLREYRRVKEFHDSRRNLRKHPINILERFKL